MENTATSSADECPDCGQKTTNEWWCDDCWILTYALQAFWAVIAAAVHPKISTCDFDDSEMRNQCRQHIRQWISNNNDINGTN